MQTIALVAPAMPNTASAALEKPPYEKLHHRSFQPLIKFIEVGRATYQNRQQQIKTLLNNLLALLLFYLLMQIYRGKYQRIERVGNGAYGVIYKVRSKSDGKVFIAKHVPLYQIEKQKAMQEFQILNKLKHHYIVRYIDNFIEEEELVIIMEYCGQRDLAWHIEQRRKNNKHFSQSLVTNWILQMLLAVGFMHSNKILHRDLKPQNIFVDSEMNLKVGDFGVSRLLDSTQQNCKTSAGSPFYMAPEMVDSQSYSYKADVWSLGCVIYEVCSLQKLFPVRDSQNRPIGLFKMIELIKHGELKQIPSFYSKELRDLVKKMLIRNPNNRPKCEELLKDKLLVQLMIKKINTNDNLKQQYPKSIEPPSLTESLLERQAESVQQQMRKLQQQVNQKINSLKNKRLQRNQLDEYEKEIKLKMKQVEKAVRTAFEELHKKGKFDQEKLQSQSKIQKEKEKVQESMSSSAKKESIKSNSSTFSDATIKSKNFSIRTKKKVEQSSVVIQSQMIESKAPSLKNQSNLSMTIQSVMVNSTRPKQVIEQVQDPFEATIQSEYSATNKDVVVVTNTLNKLDLLSQTIKNNPQALLSDSFLNCSLSLSHDPAAKTKRQNLQASKSIQLELTKKQEPRQPIEPQELHYNQDFEDYVDNEDVEERRAKELQAMLLLYEQTLADLGKSQGNNSSKQLKNKYLVMSEIKEQSNEGGSMLSRQDSLLN